MLPTVQPRTPPHGRRPGPVRPIPPPVDGHHVLAAVLMEDGGVWVRWEFDAPLAGTGEACQGLLVGGQNPAAVSFTAGDHFVNCLYAATPSAGTPWEYLGALAEVTFEDGRPGVPSFGVCVPE